MTIDEAKAAAQPVSCEPTTEFDEENDEEILMAEAIRLLTKNAELLTRLGYKTTSVTLTEQRTMRELAEATGEFLAFFED